MLAINNTEPFSEGWIFVLDVSRTLYAIACILLAVTLSYRAIRWLQRWHEPAWLHICAAVFAVCAAINGMTYLGHGITRFFIWNVSGAVFGWIFVLRTPPEKVYTWKERRGDPPDWDDFSRRLSNPG